MLLRHLKHLKSPLISSRFHPLPFSQTSSRCFHSQSDQIRTSFSLNCLHKSLFESRKHLQSLFLFKITPFSPFASLQDPLLFPSLLRSCACVSLLDFGLGLHGHLMKLGFVSWVDISVSLVELYVKLGNKNYAHKVFDEMPMKNDELFNSAVCCFGSAGFFELVLDVFQLMLESQFSASSESVCFAVMACGELRKLDKGMFVHDFVRENKFDDDVVVGNSLISMYVRIGRLDFARCAFDSMSNKDVVTWNSIINGYAQSRHWMETFKMFGLMKEVGNVSPNMVTFLGLVLACGDGATLDQGKSLHGHFIKAALFSNSRLGTAIVNMYAKCKCIEYAEMAFEEGSFQKSLVSWNSLICLYSQNGYYQEAVKLFKEMLSTDFKPDTITFSNAFPAYSALGNLEAIKSVHALLVKKGFEIGQDVVLGTTMVDAYGKGSDSAAALSLFSCIKNPNVATWNALIGVFSSYHQAQLGMLHFLKMIQSEISPDAVTVLAVLQLCGELKSLKQASMVHGYSFSKGFASHLDVENVTIDMYIRCGCVESSKRVFSLMRAKNIVSWNTMLAGLAKIGSTASAIRLFTKMLLESKSRPDAVTLLALIQASATIWGGHGVGMAHSFVSKLGLEADSPVINSLIDAYAKSGMIENGRLLFLQMGRLRDRCSWNVMIAGCGMNGQGTKACQLLSQMEEEDGYKPDSITFISLLSACSHSGLIEEGCRYFDLMVNTNKIEPSHEHWTCIIDLLGRAGRLEDAYQLVSTGLSQNLKAETIWGALLDACRMNKNLELGQVAGEKLSEIAPRNCGYQTLLSNLYASNNSWEEADRVRRVFEDRLIKKPGLSLVLT